MYCVNVCILLFFVINLQTGIKSTTFSPSKSSGEATSVSISSTSSDGSMSTTAGTPRTALMTTQTTKSNGSSSITATTTNPTTGFTGSSVSTSPKPTVENSTTTINPTSCINGTTNGECTSNCTGSKGQHCCKKDPCNKSDKNNGDHKYDNSSYRIRFNQPFIYFCILLVFTKVFILT